MCESNTIPNELKASTATSVAWDNFDRFMKTKSLKDTLHDIVGTVYQVLDNPQPNILEDNQERENSKENSKRKKRRSSYSPSDLTITPNRKIPKFLAHGMLELNEARRLKYDKTCDGISSPQKYDFLWMVDFMFIDTTQHQCGLDVTPSIVHETRPLKKCGTSHKSTSPQHQHQ